MKYITNNNTSEAVAIILSHQIVVTTTPLGLETQHCDLF